MMDKTYTLHHFLLSLFLYSSSFPDAVIECTITRHTLTRDRKTEIERPVTNHSKFLIDKIDHLPVGRSLDIFYRYGFFSLSFAVFPKSDSMFSKSRQSEEWIVREPTKQVFVDGTFNVKVQYFPSVFEKKFEIYFCDDLDDLNEAYFNRFEVENVEDSRRLFSPSISKQALSEVYGLSKSVVSTLSYSFVFVKLMRIHADSSLVNDGINAKLLSVTGSLREFNQNYGTHFVQSINIGEMIYQVFALNHTSYKLARAGFSESRNNFKTFYDFFLSPWSIEETGTIQVLSGDERVIDFVSTKLVIKDGRSHPYPNIFKLDQHPELMFQLHSLTSDSAGVTGFKFKSLSSFLPLSLQDPLLFSYWTSLWRNNL